jgi:glycosyltransferase involved in cell wall biosynthesis
MNDISVVILTFNEKLHIERCIKSLLPITKNIFIIDSYSSDKTVEIAENLGAKVYQNPWTNYAEQYQWGLDNCPIDTEWVMRMDADEYILPELEYEINFKISQVENNVNGIYIKRRVYFKDKWIKHGSYYPTWLLRIWRYKDGHIEKRWMDEHIKLTSGETIQFKNDLVDDNLNDLTWWTQKHNSYASREAIDILNIIHEFLKYDEVPANFFGTQEERKRYLKKKYANLPLFTRPLIYFLWRYFIKLGFLDGKQGLIWHFLQGGWYRFLVDAKIFELQKISKKNNQSIKETIEKEYKIKLGED